MSLHVETFGAGPDLVMLHGWAMHSGIWSGVRERLAQHFRLHLVDFPGHGFSPVCEPGTLEHLVELVADILPATCIVCGWSLGGQVAIELALRETVRVRKLALISTTPCFVKRKDWQCGNGSRNFATIHAEFEAGLRNDTKPVSYFADGRQQRYHGNASTVA